MSVGGPSSRPAGQPPPSTRPTDAPAAKPAEGTAAPDTAAAPATPAEAKPAAPAAAPATAKPTTQPTVETSRNAAQRFGNDPAAAQLQGKLNPRPESTAATASSLGGDPPVRPEASKFSATPNTAPVPKAEAEALKKKGYQDATSGRAVESLNTAPKPISGKDMMNAIVSGTRDLDKHAASSEYKDFKKFATANWKSMSPEAQAQFKTYEKYAKAAQAEKRTGIPKAEHAKMVGEMERTEASNALKKDFGVTVKKGDKQWTTEELSRAHESFSNMPVADRAKLKGLDLIRDSTAPAKSQAEMKEGTVAGEYSPNVESRNGKRVKPGSITLYDAAFPKGADARKESFHIITHEAGHAVEGRARDDAMAAHNETIDKRNTAVEKLNTTVEPNKANWTAYNSSGRAFSRARPQDANTRAFNTAQNRVTGALDKLQKATTPEAIAKAQTALDTANTARDAALAKLPADHGARDAAETLVSNSRDLETSTKNYATANADYLPANKEEKARKKDLDAVSTTTGSGETAKNTSKELSSYKSARGSEKPVSRYGATGPAEGYAEAYALYRRDPDMMKKKFPRQYAFFHKHHP